MNHPRPKPDNSLQIFGWILVGILIASVLIFIFRTMAGSGGSVGGDYPERIYAPWQ